MSVRVAPEVDDKLEALARDMKRSKSYLANEVIVNYININAWQVAHIKAALAEDEEGGPSVAHERVEEWANSWGTDNELPRPEAK